MGLSEKKGPQNPVLHRHHSPHENSHGWRYTPVSKIVKYQIVSH
jgi:hypothetical protein